MGRMETWPTNMPCPWRTSTMSRGDEGADGLADGGAGYSQVGAQLGLRRQRITRMQALGKNVVLDLGDRCGGLSHGGGGEAGHDTAGRLHSPIVRLLARLRW